MKTTICLRQTSPNTNFDNYQKFYHYKGAKNTFIEYLGTNWINSENYCFKLETRLNDLQGLENLIIANEAFMPGKGCLRNNKLRKQLGDNWISFVAAKALVILPETKLWINDFRPRDLKLWNSIREYVKQYDIPIHGLGIQVHASLLPVLPTHWASPQNVPPLLRYHCRKNRKLNLNSAFSEVTCWCDDERKRLDWYENIIKIAQEEGVDWVNLWAPTPEEHWHWQPNNKTDCYLDFTSKVFMMGTFGE